MGWRTLAVLDCDRKEYITQKCREHDQTQSNFAAITTAYIFVRGALHCMLINPQQIYNLKFIHWKCKWAFSSSKKKALLLQSVQRTNVCSFLYTKATIASTKSPTKDPETLEKILKCTLECRNEWKNNNTNCVEWMINNERTKLCNRNIIGFFSQRKTNSFFENTEKFPLQRTQPFSPKTHSKLHHSVQIQLVTYNFPTKIYVMRNEVLTKWTYSVNPKKVFSVEK